MKRSSLGNIAIATSLIAFVFLTLSFVTSSWLTSQNGSRINAMGLWTHCFTWLPDSKSLYDRRFFTGCQDDSRGFSYPTYNRSVLKATQIIFSFSFVCAILAVILSLVYFFLCRPDNKRFILMLKIQAWTCLLCAVFGTIAILIFATQRDLYVWMPHNREISFGWSMYVGVVGAVIMLISSVYYFRDVRMHARAEISSGDSHRGKGTP